MTDRPWTVITNSSQFKIIYFIVKKPKNHLYDTFFYRSSGKPSALSLSPNFKKDEIKRQVQETNRG